MNDLMNSWAKKAAAKKKEVLEQVKASATPIKVVPLEMKVGKISRDGKLGIDFN